MVTDSGFGLGIARPEKVGELVEPDARVHMIAMHWAPLCMSCCVGALPPLIAVIRVRISEHSGLSFGVKSGEV
jgi:hypothetical protein